MYKEYEVTVKFKITGDMHDMVTEEHIKTNLISELKEGDIREFEMWHEAYGEFEGISAMFLEGDVEVIKFEEFQEEENVIESRVTKPTSMNDRQNASNILQGYLDTINKAKGNG